jgi:hypothetical protein
MESSSLVRWGGLVAMVISGLFVLGGLLVLYLETAFQLLSNPGATSYITIIGIGSIVALSLALPAGMVGFHALQKGNYGRIGYAGFYTVLVAYLAGWLGILPTIIPGGSYLQVLVQAGLVGLLVGFVLYGVATLQAGMLPRWCAIAFIGVLPITVALALIYQALALVPFALIWLALSYTLWRQSSVPTQQPRGAR